MIVAIVYPLLNGFLQRYSVISSSFCLLLIFFAAHESLASLFPFREQFQAAGLDVKWTVSCLYICVFGLFYNQVMISVIVYFIPLLL